MQKALESLPWVRNATVDFDPLTATVTVEKRSYDAKKLIEDDENERADYVLQRAQIDAELALALAREQEMQAKADDAQREYEKLKKEVAQ